MGIGENGHIAFNDPPVADFDDPALVKPVALDENEMEGYVEVAEPVGVIAGVTPTTNPTSTTLLKTRLI